MKFPMLAMLASTPILVVVACLVIGSNRTGAMAEALGNPFGRCEDYPARPLLLGTRIDVALGSDLSSETAQVGDAWQGTVTEDLRPRDGGQIEPGSKVIGTVTGVTPAGDGLHAMLELGVTSIRIDGHQKFIDASAEPVIAGVLARSYGLPVVLSDLTVMCFTVRQTVALR
jgi:hypothetical protein